MAAFGQALLALADTAAGREALALLKLDGVTPADATQNLPQFLLRVDDAGDIHAEGADELIHGRVSNVLI